MVVSNLVLEIISFEKLYGAKHRVIKKENFPKIEGVRAEFPFVSLFYNKNKNWSVHHETHNKHIIKYFFTFGGSGLIGLKLSEIAILFSHLLRNFCVPILIMAYR